MGQTTVDTVYGKSKCMKIYIKRSIRMRFSRDTHTNTVRAQWIQPHMPCIKRRTPNPSHMMETKIQPSQWHRLCNIPIFSLWLLQQFNIHNNATLLRFILFTFKFIYIAWQFKHNQWQRFVRFSFSHIINQQQTHGPCMGWHKHKNETVFKNIFLVT